MESSPTFNAIIECLKISHKLKIFIDKKTNSNHDVPAIIKKYKDQRTERNLNDNIFVSIQYRKERNIKRKNLCIWFLGCDSNTFQRSIDIIPKTSKKKKTKIPILSDSKNYSRNKQNINRNIRKRKRVEMKTNDDEQPLHKKRKKKEIKIKNPECIWMLIDIAPTMSSQIFTKHDDKKQIKSKSALVRALMMEMVQNNWQKFRENHLRLFTFDISLNDLTKEPYVGWSEVLATALMTKLNEAKKSNKLVEYEQCMSYREAINGLIDKIVAQKQDKQNPELRLDRNRILLFTDAERGHQQSLCEHDELIQKLDTNHIILDCVHVTKSKRENNSIIDLCQHDNIGKYWNPINKTIKDYKAIISSEIMMDTSLRINSKNSVIELD